MIVNTLNKEENQEINRYIESLIKTFNIKIEPRITICNSREEFNKYLCEETPEWKIGCTEGREVIILSKEIIENERKNNFLKILKHEIAHIFIHKSFGKGPRWFDEGLASLLAGQNKFENSLKVNPRELINKSQFDEVKKAYEKSRKLVNDLLGGIIDEIRKSN